MPKILIEHGKHGDTFHDVTTDHQLGIACLSILRERRDAEWYGEVGEEPAPPDFSEESIATLPASMQEQAKLKWDNYRREMRAHAQDNEFLTRVNAILASKDAPAKLAKAAYRMLCARGDAQYEGVSTETPNNPALFTAECVVAKHETAFPGRYRIVSLGEKHDQRMSIGLEFMTEGGTGDLVLTFPNAYNPKGKDPLQLNLLKSGIKTMELMPDV